MAVNLEPVPFGGCNAAGTGFEVTFNVDMSNEPSVASEGVYMAGWHTDWGPDILSFPDVNGDIHSGTLRLPTPSDYPIEFQYKYLNGPGWGNEETPGPEDSCATVTNSDRLITVNNSGENVYDVFNGCNYNLSIQNFNSNDIKFVYNKNNRSVKLYSQNIENEVSQIQVFDLSGRVIKSINETNELNNSSINFQDMNNGIYIIRVLAGNTPLVKKVSIY